MPRPPLYTDAMQALERKISSGEFMLRDLPGERKLAEELGVSYMTARKAVAGLLEKDVLARQPNGSLVVHPSQGVINASCQVVLLIPAYPSVHLLHCRSHIASAAALRGAQFRALEYVHWDDAVISEALDSDGGVVIVPSTEPIPRRRLRALQAAASKVVMFDADMSDLGIPSIRLFTGDHIALLFEHLRDMGHIRIDCLNAQGHNSEIDRRVAHWRSWLRANGSTGELHDNPAPPYSDPTALAHDLTLDVLDSPDRPTAIVCSTQPAAIGAIRACHDRGVHVGHDIAIAAINNEPTGRFFTPSITGLNMPDVQAQLDICFEWFASSRKTWNGPMRQSPGDSPLFIGESTQPKPASA